MADRDRVDTVIECGTAKEVLAVVAAVLEDADEDTTVGLVVAAATFGGDVVGWEVDLDSISLDLATRLKAIRAEADRG